MMIAVPRPSALLMEQQSRHSGKPGDRRNRRYGAARRNYSHFGIN
jgi:hypothetical protein